MATFFKIFLVLVVLGLLIEYWLQILIVVGVIGVIVLIKNALSPKDTRAQEHQTDDWIDISDEEWDDEERTQAQKVFYTSHSLMVEQVLESFELLTTTTNPETYFSRLSFMEGRIQELLNDPQTTYEENGLLQNVMEQKKYTLDNFLHRFAESTIEGAEKLKTEKGKNRRIESAISKLLEYRETENEKNQAKIDATVERLKHRIPTNESNGSESISKKEVNVEDNKKQFILPYKIKYNIVPVSANLLKFKVDELEKTLFEELQHRLPSKMNLSVSLRRMSDGTLSVYYQDWPIGDVKLQGRKHKMRTFDIVTTDGNDDYTVDVIEGNVQDFIPHIDGWIRYINKLILSEEERNNF